jgi:acyl carrier protein phosphodiesterase
MNFLAHYYFHADKDDNYFTVGLTMPDLLGFHSTRIRISKNFLKNSGAAENDYNIKCHIAGMMAHLFLDRWFHGAQFFKEHVNFIQDYFTGFNKKKETFPNFFSHILVEIFIDRFLLKQEPDIADKFYQSYKNFNFFEVVHLFSSMENFNKDKFLSLARDVSNSSFLKEYTDDKAVLAVLNRVAKRVNVPFTAEHSDDDEIVKFIKLSYEKIENGIRDFMSSAKDIVKINKNEIIANGYTLLD